MTGKDWYFMKKFVHAGLATIAAALLSAAFTAGTPNVFAAITTSPADAIVTVTGTPLAAPTIPSNAIYLAPRQPIPANAKVGQVYVLPQVLPPNSQNMLVVHANPGQGVKISGYSGPVLIEPTTPAVATIVPNTTANSNSSPSTAASITPNSLGAGPKDATYMATVTNTNGEEGTGTILDFNSYWVTDNHVLNDYVNGAVYAPEKLVIESASANVVADVSGGISDLFDQSKGLASPYNVVAPSGSAHQITVVNNQTVPQAATVLNAYNPSQQDDLGYVSKSVTMTAKEVSPSGYNLGPDPDTNIYNEFSPDNTVAGWSGAGFWNGSNHLLAMLEGGNGTYQYGFNGADIVNFLSENGIPYTESTGT